MSTNTLPILAALTAGLVLSACSKASDHAARDAGGAPGHVERVATTPLARGDLPKMAPGQWRTQTISVQGVGKAERETLEEPELVCIEPSTNVFDALGTDASNCSRFDLGRSGAAYTVNAQCASASVQSSVKGSFSGDFKTKVVADIELGVAPVGQPLEIMKIKLESRYVGPCPAEG
jgi:hypothetical protein